MTAIDHVLAGLLAASAAAQLFARIDPARLDRMLLYRAGALSGLLFAVLPLLAWSAAGRPLDRFGLHGWTGGGAVAIAWTAGLAGALLLVGCGLGRKPVAALWSRYAWLMPRDGRELGASAITSLIAGAGEEIAFRGFLLWYAAALAGTTGALLASTVLFAIAHSYQRLPGMIGAGVAGLILGLFYLGSGALLLAIWIHASWNMASFATGWLVLRFTGEDGRGSL